MTDVGALQIEAKESELDASLAAHRLAEAELKLKIENAASVSAEDRAWLQNDIKALSDQVERELQLSRRLTEEIAFLRRERGTLMNSIIGKGDTCNQLEPFSVRLPQRDSNACERYMNLVNRGQSPWSTMISTRVATRSTINNDPGRVKFERMSNADLLESVAPENVKEIMRENGLLGEESELMRIENDRPRIVDGNRESIVSETQGQLLNQINIFT